MKILAIETSCDETAAAVIEDGTKVLSSIVSSQIDLHSEYGGVVPEIASRAHVELLNPVVAQAMQEAGFAPGEKPDVIACTNGPGLVGALLVGVSGAKALSLAWDVPYIGINHLEGHLYASWIEDPSLELPLITLLVSGGHTMIVAVDTPGSFRILGQTIDDAAGEAFDKVARAMGLGYPGGPIIDRLAQEGDAKAIKFPKAMRGDNYDFSFSGIKTSVVNYLRKNPDANPADVAASFQAAVVDVLLDKALRAADEIGAKSFCLGGGVAANSALREQAKIRGEESGLKVFLPSRSMCTDNAAMIGAAAWYRWHSDGPTAMDTGAYPNLRLATTS